MQTQAAAALSDDLRARLDALDVDVSCALRFSRATLYALAAMSKDARVAIDRCLREEAAIVRVDDLKASDAIAATLNEARRHIAAADTASDAVRDLERMLVESAADLEGALAAAASNDRSPAQSAG
ncbi:hypothetical protein [Caulobacter mirabilis]|uniref:hypothetical protein n=1 Tax=Caulobacter mirabilis TaxID=69666 RepID=UPI0012374436|nr:hypothetical protein [Caulobacter mirabilis]